jgi:hypothetical protein
MISVLLRNSSIANPAVELVRPIFAPLVLVNRTIVVRPDHGDIAYRGRYRLVLQKRPVSNVLRRFHGNLRRIETGRIEAAPQIDGRSGCRRRFERR